MSLADELRRLAKEAAAEVDDVIDGSQITQELKKAAINPKNSRMEAVLPMGVCIREEFKYTRAINRDGFLRSWAKKRGLTLEIIDDGHWKGPQAKFSWETEATT